jgi:hypothetical protein
MGTGTLGVDDTLWNSLEKESVDKSKSHQVLK